MTRILDILFGAGLDNAARRRAQLHRAAELAELAAADFLAAGDIASANANKIIAMQHRRDAQWSR